MRPAEIRTGSSVGRLSSILHRSLGGAPNDSGSQSPPCSPTSSTFNPSASFYTSSDSSFAGYSTPSLRSALLPHPIYMNAYEPQFGEPVPSTKNELDAKEKAMLLKKARKLSRVLGDIPAVVQSVVPATTTHKRSPSALHKRSISMASIASTSASSCARHSADGRPSQPDVSPPPEVPSLPHITESRLSGTQDESIRDNRSQSSLPLATSRPSNHEGEATRSSMAQSLTQRAKPSFTLPTPDPITATLATPPPPHSPRLATRRRSIDALPPSLEAAPKSAQAKRSRSMAIRKKTRQEASQESVDFRTRYNDNFGGNSDMSIRQKSANVQRARKMAKVFGQDPPSDLIHISDDSRSALNRLPVAGEEPESIPTTPTLAAFSQSKNASPRDIHEDSASGPTFTSDFRDRRRRAEKLSRFFGVAYQNIDYVPPPPLIPPMDTDVQVDVKVSRSRFWGFDGGEKTREADMNDVIDRLRGLKAT